jgi:hypothetical protein
VSTVCGCVFWAACVGRWCRLNNADVTGTSGLPMHSGGRNSCRCCNMYPFLCAPCLCHWPLLMFRPNGLAQSHVAPPFCPFSSISSMHCCCPCNMRGFSCVAGWCKLFSVVEYIYMSTRSQLLPFPAESAGAAPVPTMISGCPSSCCQVNGHQFHMIPCTTTCAAVHLLYIGQTHLCCVCR